MLILSPLRLSIPARKTTELVATKQGNCTGADSELRAGGQPSGALLLLLGLLDRLPCPAADGNGDPLCFFRAAARWHVIDSGNAAGLHGTDKCGKGR